MLPVRVLAFLVSSLYTRMGPSSRPSHPHSSVSSLYVGMSRSAATETSPVRRGEPRGEQRATFYIVFVF